MILELTYARGMQLWLDGQAPDNADNKGWSIGEEDDHLTFSKYDGSPLTIGQHKIIGLKSDVPFDEVNGDNLPKRLTLLFADNTSPITMAVTHYAWGDPDAEWPVKVKLTNGDLIDVDEITLFLRASAGILENVEPERIVEAPWEPPFDVNERFEPKPAPDCVKSYDVYASYDGNAPSSKSVIACSSPELAKAVADLIKTRYDHLCFCDGYEWWKTWAIAESVCKRDSIVCSIAEAKERLAN